MRDPRCYSSEAPEGLCPHYRGFHLITKDEEGERKSRFLPLLVTVLLWGGMAFVLLLQVFLQIAG